MDAEVRGVAAALRLLPLRRRAAHLRRTIDRSRRLVAAIGNPGRRDDELRAEIRAVNALSALCDKDELEWPIDGARVYPLRILRDLLRGG